MSSTDIEITSVLLNAYFETWRKDPNLSIELRKRIQVYLEMPVKVKLGFIPYEETEDE